MKCSELLHGEMFVRPRLRASNVLVKHADTLRISLLSRGRVPFIKKSFTCLKSFESVAHKKNKHKNHFYKIATERPYDDNQQKKQRVPK